MADGGTLIPFGFCRKCVVTTLGWEIPPRVRVIIVSGKAKEQLEKFIEETNK